MERKHLPKSATPIENAELARRKEASPTRYATLAQVEPAVGGRADKIEIRDLEVFANHGVYPEENALGQKFVVSLTLFTDLRAAGERDDLEASIDYGAVCHAVDSYMRSRRFKLIEAVAEGIAGELLDAYPALLAVCVRVEKPWAPIGLPVRTVAVEIERGR